MHSEPAGLLAVGEPVCNASEQGLWSSLPVLQPGTFRPLPFAEASIVTQN